MFGFGGVFGRKPNKFNYRPLYYDEQKEALEQRKRNLLGVDYANKYKTTTEKEEAKGRYIPGVYIRDSMKDRRGILRSPKSNSVAVRRLIIIAVLLLLATWWLLSTDSINNIFVGWLAK